MTFLVYQDDPWITSKDVSRSKRVKKEKLGGDSRDCMAVGRMAQIRFSVVRILLTECTVWPNLYNLCHFSQLSSEI